jgi:hypothetical protein
LVSALPFKRLDPRTVSSVQSILTLANKYGAERLKTRIVEHLEADWPQTLWQWDRLETEIQSMKDAWNQEFLTDSEGSAKFIDDYLPEPASAINVAWACNIPSVLPAAFYHLSRLSIYDDYHLVRSSDACDALSKGRRTARWTTLTADHYICLLKGREKLSMVAEDIDFKCHTLCSTWSCVTQGAKLLEETRKACRHSADVLHTLRHYAEQASDYNTCSNCSSQIRQTLITSRRKLWRELSIFFGLADLQ